MRKQSVSLWLVALSIVVSLFLFSSPTQAAGGLCDDCSSSNPCADGYDCQYPICVPEVPNNGQEGDKCYGTSSDNNCGTGLKCEGSWLGVGLLELCNTWKADQSADFLGLLDNQCVQDTDTAQIYGCLNRDGQCSDQDFTSADSTCVDGVTYNECNSSGSALNHCWINGNGQEAGFDSNTKGGCVTANTGNQECGTVGNECCRDPNTNDYLECTSGTKTLSDGAQIKGKLVYCSCTGGELGATCEDDGDCLNGNCEGGKCSIGSSCIQMEGGNKGSCDSAGGYWCQQEAGEGEAGSDYYCCPGATSCRNIQPESKGGRNIPYELCLQIPDSTQRGKCQTCYDAGSIWTAVGCISYDPSEGIGQIIYIGLGVAGSIALISILAAAFLFTTSHGDPQKVTKAKELMQSAIIGLLFTIFSITILQFIARDLLRIPGFGG